MSQSTALQQYLRPPQTTVELRERRHAVLVTLFPLAGTLLALGLAFIFGVGWTEMGLFLTFYLLGEIGAEVGHHRYFSHRAFKAHPALKVTLAALASMSGKGSIFEFAAVHRRHHYYSDQPGDPHSPNLHGKGFWNRSKGLWHAYYGWLLKTPLGPSEHAWVLDLLKDQSLVRVANKRMYYFWLSAGVCLPALLGYFLVGGFYGALMGALWGGAVRLFLEQHTAYAINSFGHVFGRRDFETDDQSRNNFFLGIFTLGVGWHNNHHAFPFTAYNQFRWWQLDPCGWLISLLERVGLISNSQYPTPEQMSKKQVKNF